MTGNKISGSPWKWLPTLYVAEALPYVIINVLTVLMYTRLGVGMKDMALYTSWLYLPWVIKPFWAPIVDIYSTKRRWILAMQTGIAVLFGAVVFFLASSDFFYTTIFAFFVAAFFSATHDIAADGYYMLALDSHQQAAFVGIRSTFYRIGTLLGQGGLIAVAGIIEKYYCDSADSGLRGWQGVFIISAVFFGILAAYHSIFLPRVEKRRNKKDDDSKNSIKDSLRVFCSIFIKFFSKKHLFGALCFLLLYRLPEALCVKVLQPFLVAARPDGGLGMSLSEVAVTSGTTGVIALLAGGIVGGLMIARNGLKFWLLPMAASLSLPCVLYLLLALLQPETSGSGFVWINVAVFIEQFGYGFGFTAYMLYMIYFSEGEYKTSDYAFCTAFMALGMMLPGMFAGYIFEWLDDFAIFSMDVPSHGYINFFLLVTLMSLVTFLACTFVRITPGYGKK